jgi:hypothetical protein
MPQVNGIKLLIFLTFFVLFRDDGAGDFKMTNLEDLLGNSDNDLISLNGLVQNLSQELFITLMHETITPPQ